MHQTSERDGCDALHSSIDIKEEFLTEPNSPSIRLPSLFLDDCSSFITHDFKEFGNVRTNTDIMRNEFCNESDNDELVASKSPVRKNKRKSLLPQRAIQLEVSQSGSLGNSSESSQDVTDSFLFNSNVQLNSTNEFTNALNDIMLPTNDSDIDIISEDALLDDFTEDGIFKDLQHEVEPEKLNEEIIDNVKEEWRAHWGVKCNMCEQVFPYKIEFDKHYTESYNLHPVYTCTFCNKTAEKYSTFRSHCYRHITEGRYKCEICSKGFSLQSMLDIHMLAKHTKSKPFICEVCGRSFVTKPGLKVHGKKHKTEQKEDYPCVECGKVLHTRGGLTSHMNVHRLGRRFMCDVCGKTFTQKVNMLQHVKQHTGDKPHECDKCGKAFAERSHLVRHYSFHSEERPFKCQICQKMYKTERCLKVHSLVHAAERPYLCAVCNKGFLSITKLKQHANIHTGERPYKCKYCERGFTNYPNWLKHIRRRHKVDHKTGELLKPKVPKEEEEPPPPTPQGLVEIAPAPAPSTGSQSIPLISAIATIPPASVVQQQDVVIGDLGLSKVDEFVLQQSFLGLPVIEDKLFLPQQIDFSNNPNGTMSFILPYFSSQVPGHQTIIQHPSSTPLSELLHGTTLTFCD